MPQFKTTFHWERRKPEQHRNDGEASREIGKRRRLLYSIYCRFVFFGFCSLLIMFLVTPNFWKTVWCPEMIPQNLGYFFWTPNSDYATFFLDTLCTYYTSFDRIPREEFIFSFCLHLRDACVCFSRLFNEVFFLADLSGKSRKEKSFFFFYFRYFLVRVFPELGYPPGIRHHSRATPFPGKRNGSQA